MNFTRAPFVYHSEVVYDDNRRNYVHSIFPYTSKPLVEGINWTDETLSYMRGRGTANKILYSILKPKFSTFNVVDATANIGGDTINSRLAPFVLSVKAYEPDPDRFRMLTNNLRLYGIEDTVQAYNRPFDYVIPTNSVVLLDPPFDNFAIEDRSIYDTLADIVPRAAVVLNAPVDFLFSIKEATRMRARVECYRFRGKRVKIYLITKGRGLGNYAL